MTMFMGISSNYIFYLFISLLAQRNEPKKGHPMNPPSGFVGSFGKFRPRPTRSVSLRSDMGRFFPEFSFTRSPGSKGIKNEKQDLTLIFGIAEGIGMAGARVTESTSQVTRMIVLSTRLQFSYSLGL